MNRDLPDWAQSPFVLIPFFAACFAVPVLIGISDRAAEFAGGFSAAIAAVVAVVLGGAVQRSNDRAREQRQAAARGLRHVRALELNMSMFASMTNLLLKQTSVVKKTGTLAGFTKSREELEAELENAAAEIPAHLFESSFELSDDLPIALMVYRLGREKLSRVLATHTGAIDRNVILTLHKSLTLVLEDIRAVERALDRCRSAMNARKKSYGHASTDGL